MTKLTGNHKAEQIANELKDIGKKAFNFIERKKPEFRREVINRIFTFQDIKIDDIEIGHKTYMPMKNHKSLRNCVDIQELLNMFNPIIDKRDKRANYTELSFDRGIFSDAGSSIKYTTGSKIYDPSSFHVQSVLFYLDDLDLAITIRLTLSNKKYRFRYTKDGSVKWAHLKK